MPWHWWRALGRTTPPPEDRHSDFLVSLPRPRKIVEEEAGYISPPMMRRVSFRVGVHRVLGRLLIWSYAAVYFFGGNLLDRLRRRASEERRAARLRRAFQRVGGTLVKIGQQLSLRIDILPYAYCVELGKLRDRMPVFEARYAFEAVERASGREPREVFRNFDPDPVGSASIACVFQATLHNGHRVAVKVRRPGIGELFTADLRALDLLGRFLELFTLLRPGFTESVREDMWDTLMEELDFRREARYQELFRRRTRKVKTKFLTAPRVYFDFCSDEVIVMQFVTGTMLSEVLAAVEQNDEEALRILRRRKITKEKVARRLLWANHAAMIADLFFHADPSPSNVIVLPRSRLMFIDFGSCGAFSHSQRRALKEINYFQDQGDAEGMARASVSVLEPLPPIDVDKFRKRLEALYRTSLYAMKSKHSEWWERTTAVQWLSFMQVALDFGVPLPKGILHMIRATLLYDTLAARLDRNTVFYDEFRRYEKFAGKRAKRRLKKKVRKNLHQGLDYRYYLRITQLIDTGERAFYRVQKFLDSPVPEFVLTLKKSVYAVVVFLRFSGAALLGAFVAGTIFGVLARFRGEPVDLWGLAVKVSESTWYHAFLILLALLAVRRLMFRLTDKDPHQSN